MKNQVSYQFESNNPRDKPKVVERERIATTTTHRLHAKLWMTANLFACAKRSVSNESMIGHQGQGYLQIVAPAESPALPKPSPPQQSSKPVDQSSASFPDDAETAITGAWSAISHEQQIFSNRRALFFFLELCSLRFFN
jgi:hypothetical protein